MTDPEDAGARKDSISRGTDREDCLRSISETGQADKSMIIKAVKEPEYSKSSEMCYFVELKFVHGLVSLWTTALVSQPTRPGASLSNTELRYLIRLHSLGLLLRVSADDEHSSHQPASMIQYTGFQHTNHSRYVHSQCSLCAIKCLNS